MKWLFYQKETSERGRIVLIYHQEPTEEDIQSIGLPYVESDNYSQSEKQFGKKENYYVNPQTGDVWVEYSDRELTEEEEQELILENLQTQQDALTLEILALKGLI